MTPSQPSSARSHGWWRSPLLRTGLVTGAYLSAVFVAWLLVANRVPWSANFAGVRNAVALALAALAMLMPVWRFLRAPVHLLAAGVLAWVLLALTYKIMGVFFHRLESRMGAFHLFMLGAVVYGVIAVLAWVASLVLAARHHDHT